MKNIFIALALVIALATPAMADLLDYGQNEGGLYYTSETQNHVYSRDLSCQGNANSNMANQHCTYVSPHVDTSKAEKRREELRRLARLIGLAK